MIEGSTLELYEVGMFLGISPCSSAIVFPRIMRKLEYYLMYTYYLNIDYTYLNLKDVQISYPVLEEDILRTQCFAFLQ